MATRQSHFYPDNHKNIQTVVKDGQWQSLVRHGKSIVARQAGQGLDQFFLVNESTGAVLRQDKGEAQLSLHRYDAYGKPLQNNPADDTDFTWKQELSEPETGLTYLRHRFHHPQLRRFITRDNLHIDNRYAYAHGDPVNYIDPTGHSAVGRYVGAGVSVGLGLLGAILAIPTAGASLGLSATSSTVSGVVSGIAGIAGGALLAGSQLALNSGNKAVATALTVLGSIAAVVSLGSTAVAIAPKLVENGAELTSSVIKEAKAIETVASEEAESVNVAARTEATVETAKAPESGGDYTRFYGNKLMRSNQVRKAVDAIKRSKSYTVDGRDVKAIANSADHVSFSSHRVDNEFFGLGYVTEDLIKDITEKASAKAGQKFFYPFNENSLSYTFHRGEVSITGHIEFDAGLDANNTIAGTRPAQDSESTLTIRYDPHNSSVAWQMLVPRR